MKFLYGVNGETRKLVKRSSRAGDLKEKFKVYEMSSISTLEVAWEHYPWGTCTNVGEEEEEGEFDEQYFCYRVAKTNKLELLKWVSNRQQTSRKRSW